MFYFAKFSEEGLPYAILEAMNHGILVIANDIPGINSLIKNNYSEFN